MMTLEEAITHAEERASADCSECAKEHAQLAEWLKELKSRRGVEIRNHAPVVDAKPVVHGHWKEVTANEFYGSGSYAIAGYVCSHCGFDIETADYEQYNFCPNCGADNRKDAQNGT